MVELSELEIEDPLYRLFMHFDVEGHFLKLDTFIKTAESARRIVDSLDKTFFQNNLSYELLILPPEDGTFLSKIAIYIGGGTAAVFTFLNSDIGSAYVEGLTGHPPTHWAFEAGEATKILTKNTSKKFENLVEFEEIPYKIHESKLADEQSKCLSVSNLVIAMTRGVLEMTTDTLEKLGMEIGSLPDAMDARADFYTACIEDHDIRRLGFTSDAEFPIQRSSFPERAQRPERKQKTDDSLPWIVSIENIYVTSPNWDEKDQKTRQWKGKDNLRRDCYFVIEDAEFWHLVRRKCLHVEVLDNLKVQWACQIIDDRPRNRRVLRILEFNGERLAEPLTDDAIRSILGSYWPDAPPPNQPTLFDL